MGKAYCDYYNTINVKSILGVIKFTLNFLFSHFILCNSRVKSKWEKQKLNLRRIFEQSYGLPIWEDVPLKRQHDGG